MKTVSLGLSRQLKEAGIEQVSSFYWHTNKYGHPPFIRDTKENTDGLTDLDTYSAFLADEILDQLPSKIDEFVFKVLKGNTGSYCIVYSNDHDVKRHICWYPNLADACAKMWLYLKKEGLL